MASGGSPGSSGGTGGAAPSGPITGSPARSSGEPPIARAARRPLGHEPRRRSATPARMTTPPTTWAGRIASPRKIAAIATARAGTRNWRAVTRVGPSSFTPWNTMTLANPAASVPE